MDMPVWPGGAGFSVLYRLEIAYTLLIIFDIVVNGIISMPIAVAAYFFLPDTPGTAKPNWIFTKRVRVARTESREVSSLIPWHRI
jgi:hypothetical protein